jgi:endoglycosylceramidase
MQSLKILVLAAVLLGTVVSQKGHITIDTNTRMMKDEARRTVMFHGVNVVYKVAPYIPSSDKFDPQLSLNDQDIDDLLRWGFNFVRLGVMWESVETSPDTYNETYLNEVEVLINKLGAKGIYTLVDAHQDVFARRICGEGVPNFYATDSLLDH